MAGSTKSLGALTLSLLLHALVVALAPQLAAARHEPPPQETPDVWSGDTVDIEAPGGASPAPSEPAPQPPEAAPAPPAPPPPAEPVSVAPEPEAPSELRPKPAAPKPATPELARPEPPPEPRRPPPEPPATDWERLFAARAEQTGSSTSGNAGPVSDRTPVRNLARAFHNSLILATSSDPIWRSIPLGDAGTVTVDVVVSAEQRIVSAEPREEVVPRHLQQLVKRTLSYLRSGRFSISATGVGAGRETLRVRVLLSAVASADTSSDFALDGEEYPRLGRPGKARFRAMGRAFEATITVVSSRSED